MERIEFCETAPVKLIIIHEPKYEVFMSMLHPAASLYKDVIHIESVSNCFAGLKQQLSNLDIELKSVREILKKDRQSLLYLAFLALDYEGEIESLNSLGPDDRAHIDYYLSDKYKKENLEKLSSEELVDVVLTRPIYTLRYYPINTNCELVEIKFRPLGNLLFVRDQQIITKKGVILGRTGASQREIEHLIMYQVFKNLNIEFIGEIPMEGLLEGGDFYPMTPDLALLGIGIRTNMEAANYLMENDLLGTSKFGLVVDETDLNQERMHLDTFFNIIDEKNVVLIDFEELSKISKKQINRKVLLYEKNEENGGKYELVKTYTTFEPFLEDEGFNIIKFSYEEFQKFLPNYLHIGNNTILSVNRSLKDIIKRNNIEHVNVIDVEFESVTKMYGALHCATQAFRYGK